MQATLWVVAGGATLIAGVASLADRRRSRRRDLDRVGWVPWPGVLIVAIIVAALATALALKAGD